MKPLKSLARSVVGILLFTICLSLFASTAYAYEEDTHFIMTYVICRSVGFTPQEAMIVAAVNQGMDDSPGTRASKGPMDFIPQMPEEWIWHALDLDGEMKAEGVLKRKDRLFEEALTETTLRNKLIRLGIFFHYQQDTWAHRHHHTTMGPYTDNHLSRDNYTTYNTPLGHGIDGHQPDRPPFDPVAALMNLEDGIGYARTFLKQALNREPGTFFANYTSQGGSDDARWSKKGTFYNRISVEGVEPNSPRAYLVALIYAQIEAYTYYDVGKLGPRYANIADFSSISKGLEKVCKYFQPLRSNGIRFPEITIPNINKKFDQGFNTMTTTMLMSTLPVRPQFIGVGPDKFLYRRDTLASKWIQIPDSGYVSAIATAGFGKTILGIGNDGSMFQRDTPESQWVQKPNSAEVKAVTIGRQGAIFGVGIDNLMYRWVGKWEVVKDSGFITGIAGSPEGWFIGIGLDGTLFKRDYPTSQWVHYPNGGSIAAIALMQDGSLIGIGKDKQVYTRESLEKSWILVPDSGGMIAIAELPLTN